MLIDAAECRRQAAACELEALTTQHDAVRASLLQMACSWTELANAKDHLQAILGELDRPTEPGRQ
jgi:hypothetical protein